MKPRQGKSPAPEATNTLSLEQLLGVVNIALAKGDCSSLVLSDAESATLLIRKITIRPLEVQGQPMWQFSRHEARRVTHLNLPRKQAVQQIALHLDAGYRQVVVRDGAQTAHYRRGRNNTWRVKVTPLPAADIAMAKSAVITAALPSTTDLDSEINSPPASTLPSQSVAVPRPVTGHNRAKQYLLPEHQPVPFLIAAGVMTPAGQVRSPMYHKFRQINRFLELVNDTVPHLPTHDPLTIVDFGCGKSYLTFALHYLLTEIHGRSVHITGIDRKQDVVDRCTEVATELQCTGLRFFAGEIGDYTGSREVDLAVALHACDIATDDALLAAVRWNCSAILAVPCCQHELAPLIEVPELAPLSRHGILHERLAALATDALRAQWLELRGYHTQVVEFIETEHTAKNLLIRAWKRILAPRELQRRQAEYDRCRALLGLENTYLDRQWTAANTSAIPS